MKLLHTNVTDPLPGGICSCIWTCDPTARIAEFLYRPRCRQFLPEHTAYCSPDVIRPSVMTVGRITAL